MHAWENELFVKTRADIRYYLNDMLQRISFLKALKERNAKGTGWQIDSNSDFGKELYDIVELNLLQKLDVLPGILHNYEFDDFLPELIAEWEQSLSAFPTSEGFSREDKVTDEDGNVVAAHLSLKEIIRLLDSIDKCKSIADRISLPSDEAMVNRFVAYMIDNNVPKSRGMYRCWYDALDCFWGISDVIKESHKNLPPSSYAESNYIKSFATRYK